MGNCLCTTSGCNKYCIMPYNLLNSPSIFQGYIKSILMEMLGKSLYTSQTSWIIHPLSNLMWCIIFWRTRTSYKLCKLYSFNSSSSASLLFLTSLLKGGIWDSHAQQAFQNIKKRFTTVPYLSLLTQWFLSSLMLIPQRQRWEYYSPSDNEKFQSFI